MKQHRKLFLPFYARFAPPLRLPQLIPETAKHSQGKKFKIVVHKELAEESDTNAMLGNVDIKNEARPVIAQLKETMTGNMNVAKQELLNLLDQEEQVKMIEN